MFRPLSNPGIGELSQRLHFGGMAILASLAQIHKDFIISGAVSDPCGLLPVPQRGQAEKKEPVRLRVSIPIAFFP